MDTTKGFTICPLWVDHSLTGARQAGLDIERLLIKSGISPQALQIPGQRIPVEQVVMLQRYCNGALNDEAAGQLEKPARLGFFRQMALTAVHGQNLGQALQRSVEFYNLFENSFLFRISTRGRQTELWLEPIPGHRVLDHYAVNYLLSIFHRFIGWLGNHRIILNQVRLSFPPPEYHDELHYTYYGAPVLFNQERNDLSFDSGYLEHPVVQTEATVENYMLRGPLDLYLPLDAGGEITEVLRILIQDVFNHSDCAPNLNQLATEIGLTPQTLRRRLKREGTSLHTIKAQVRRDIAIHYLGNLEHSIEMIAEKAGYSEPSAFIRAFKSWTGFTPLQFRKGLELK